ncbi:uncharacterized protein LOC126106701 [Schistocerca cancellata]|uniref:uncharacterized protein LOC126106701 n=1 Tax=Schistocerca cancellata TaxID=274614 RepID=UPI00211899AD|nr:uncharacterized protein LOC126106701 [Schistocerca cancellata]
MAGMAGMDNLSYDMLLSTFSFLPVPDLAKYAAVSSQWHGIVTGYTHLWKGKTYTTCRRPSESAETRAVLRILPPLQHLIIELADQFAIQFDYPQMTLSLTDTRGLEEFPKLTCDFLLARGDIVSNILSSQSSVDLAALRNLQILRLPPVNVADPPVFRPEPVVRSALQQCPNLTGLFICADHLSADYLDTLEGLDRLHTLEIVCPRLDKLAFLRHCSNSLEVLHLCCIGVPQQEYTELRRLANLRRLRLHECQVAEGELRLALEALGSLEALQLDRCCLVRDLSLLWRCARLRQLRLTLPPVAGAPLVLRDPRLQGLQLNPRVRMSVDADQVSLRLRTISVYADGLPDALQLLQALGVDAGSLGQLATLPRCPQLSHLCLNLLVGSGGPQHSVVWVHIKLTSST